MSMSGTIDTNNIKCADTTKLYAKSKPDKKGLECLITYVPKGIAEHLGLKSGERLQWLMMNDGSITVKKVEYHVGSKNIQG